MKKNSIWIMLAGCFLLAGCGVRPPANAETETETLTLATLGGADLSHWVNLYNEKHPEVKIETVNYLDNYPDPREALNQIKIEITAGQGPDLINFGRQYSPLDASSGMLADLYPFLQEDESFDRQDYYCNILDAFAVGDSLYVLVPGYKIDSYATVNDQLAWLEGMNVQQLEDAYNMLGDDGILFPGETKKAVFGMMCYGSLENYIDWAEGTCDFNRESFKEILHFANQFPLHLNITDEYSAKEMFAGGQALLYPVSIDDASGITGVRMLFGKTPVYIGYPFDQGCGTMAGIASLAMGISASSKNMEASWDFIRSFLDSEYQDSITNALPLRVSSMEQKLEEAMRAEYDANGEKVAKGVLRFEGEEPVEIYEITEEDAETLRSLIRKIENNATVDYNLYNILLEEVEYLFNEDRNIDDVANIIQNRASIYISENKQGG